MIKYHAIVLAAGQGKRMRTGENKQFITIQDKPLILHTLDVFDTDDWCSAITLVINPKEEARMNELVGSASFRKQVDLVKGGAERQQSVFEGLKSLSSYEGPVFIHDGARPFISPDTLHTLAEVTDVKRAALLAVPVTDTIKQKSGNQLKTLDRKTLWAAQTPQCFDYSLIMNAHEKAAEEGYIGTDDSSLVERYGEPVEIVQGSYDNIKITTPEDLGKARAYLDYKQE
ncbi:2-C-methyl-D-erythritol 4-phosphate cytidylyltransferase [Sediminibacillus massiliensis]|uniref:2-C-methyl-D-erythritol 4-phosphate cytidylyltransferase n=1 Tax=Sediminibacillus massiliensis TaxID=1926277 RepID=UPI0015C3F15E|nr:2-C-methyl-D-erythritol 4-phosphate cytidylyltransferase [Sediminibacillus massiliensis]